MSNTIAQVARNDGAEYGVIGAAVLDTRSCSEAIAFGLEPHEFSWETNGEIWRAIVAIAKAGRPVDYVTVTSEVAGALFEHQDGGVHVVLGNIIGGAFSPGEGREYAKLVREAHLRRQAASLGARMVVEAVSRPLPEVLAEHETLVGQLYACDGRESGAMRTAKEGLRAVMDTLDECSRLRAQGAPVPTGYQCGIPEVDRLVGGFAAKKLYVVAARPGVGKTSALMQIANGLVDQGLKPAVFSLEMSEADALIILLGQRISEALFNRLGEHYTGCSSAAIKSADLKEGEWAELHIAGRAMIKSGLLIDDRKHSLASLRAEMRRAVKVLGAQVVLVDYLQEVRNYAPAGTPRNVIVAEIAQGLVDAAKDLGVPVIAAAQLNREVEKGAKPEARKPKMSDLGESSKIEQAATTILALHRDTHPSAPPEARGYTDMLTLKNRQRAPGEERMRWHGPSQLLRANRQEEGF